MRAEIEAKNFDFKAVNPNAIKYTDASASAKTYAIANALVPGN